MLALTRRAGEEIVIGDPESPLGVIRIVTIHGDKVKLSFDFPREVMINRRELADLKKQNRKPDHGKDDDHTKCNGDGSKPDDQG